MSYWTHVVGAICIDTYGKNAINKVKEFLLTAPKITGSEGNVEYFLNQSSGHNVTDISCNDEGEQIINAYETRVLITIFGNLRDRKMKQTQKEVSNFVKSLEQKFNIDYKSIEIIG